MHRAHLPTVVLVAAATGGCHVHTPAPVDLAAHARAFAARLADLAAHLSGAAVGPGEGPFDLADGLDRREAHLLAVWFHPDCRLARQRAGVAAVGRDEAGRWADPSLEVSAARILASVPHEWLVAAALQFTVPLSGRLGGEVDLATAELDEAVLAARAVEADVVHRTDLAFARWSAETRRADALRDLCAQLRDLERIAARLGEAGEHTQQETRAFMLERLLREAELAQAEHALATGELTLKRTLGLHPDAAVQFVQALAPPLAVADPAARRERLLAGPRLLQLQRAHEVAERRLALEVLRQWPDLLIAPGWQEEDAQPRAALGLSLPLPLFTGNTPAIRRAEAEREVAAERLRAGVETALHDLAAAEAAFAAARRQQELARELLPLTARQLEDGRRLAELGQLEPLLILDSLVRVHAAAMQTIAADLAAAEATIELNRLFWDPATTADHREDAR